MERLIIRWLYVLTTYVLNLNLTGGYPPMSTIDKQRERRNELSSLTDEFSN